MAKNMKSTNSKLAKLFLLGCANAAILTGMSGIVKADIPIADILAKNENFTNLPLREQLTEIATKFEVDGISGRQKIQLMNIRNQITEQLNAGGGANFKDKAEQVDAVAQNNKPTFGEVNEEQMLASILKGADPKLAALQGPIKVEAAKQQLNSFDNSIKRLVFAYNSNDLPVANKQEIMNELFASPFSKEVVEHIIFNSNITDLDVKKAAINYTKVGGSELLKLIKEKATPAQKEILLGTIENYSKNHLVDQFINSSSLPERKKVLNFVNATTFDKFIEVMNEIVDQDIDVEKTNDLFKAKNLITADRKLTEIEIKD